MREELDTAWAIFDLIKYRSTETAPDISTFGLMIHACALRGEAERALELFRYMTVERGLEPDEKIYNTLIHTCAVRKDYFLDSWKYAIEMRNKGIKVSLWTLNLLLQACGKAGDLTRARLLVRLMMSAGSSEYQPDERSFQHLLRAYATAKLVKGANTMPQEAFFLGPTPGGNNGTQLTEEALDKLPFMKAAVLDTKRDILSEATAVVRYISYEKPEFYSTRILNAYMDVCLTQHGHYFLKTTYQYYFAKADGENEEHAGDFDEPVHYDPTHIALPQEVGLEEEPEKDPTPRATGSTYTPTRAKKPPRSLWTFEIALEYARKQRNIIVARKVWGDRMKFCKTAEYWSMMQAVRRRLDFTAESLMMQTLAKCGYLDEALQRLEVLQHEYPWTQRDLKILYDMAIAEEDMGAVERLRKVLKLDDKVW